MSGGERQAEVELSFAAAGNFSRPGLPPNPRIQPYFPCLAMQTVVSVVAARFVQGSYRKVRLSLRASLNRLCSKNIFPFIYPRSMGTVLYYKRCTTRHKGTWKMR